METVREQIFDYAMYNSHLDKDRRGRNGSRGGRAEEAEGLKGAKEKLTAALRRCARIEFGGFQTLEYWKQKIVVDRYAGSWQLV